jgi:hypothetical protein
MDEQKPDPISPQIRYSAIGPRPAPLIVDVRHDATFEADGRVLVSACREVLGEGALWGCSCQEPTHNLPSVVGAQ